MGKRLFVVALVVALVFAVVALAGCSSSSSSTSSTTGTSTQGSTGGSTGGLDGQQVIQQKCGTCHSAQQADKKLGSKMAAETVVNDMINKGAQLTPEEKQAVIDYLAQ